MNFFKRLFGKKVNPLEVITNITLQLQLTYPYHDEKSIIQNVKISYGLDDAAARAYYDETFEGLKKSGGLKK
jgi:hypothetical protein